MIKKVLFKGNVKKYLCFVLSAECLVLCAQCLVQSA